MYLYCLGVEKLIAAVFLFAYRPLLSIWSRRFFLKAVKSSSSSMMCFSFASVIVCISHCKALWVKSQTFFARKLQITIDISHVDNYNNHIGQLSSKKDRQKGVNIMNPLEIKGARARLGFTQKYMAEKLGLTEVSYGRKERGEVEFTLDEVPEVASLLTLNNAQVNDFFFDGKLPTG